MKKFFRNIRLASVFSLALLILLFPGCASKNKKVGAIMSSSANSSGSSSSVESSTQSSLASSVSSTASTANNNTTSRKQSPATKSGTSSASKNPVSGTSSQVLYQTPSDDSCFFTGKPLMTNLTNKNSDFMGDNDGPAYLVLSKTGYNKASIDIMLNELRMNLVRKSDGKCINAYIFLGIYSYDSNGNYRNNADAGLVYKGGAEGKWHIFHSINIVSPTTNQTKWYESRVGLATNHNYRLVLDSSKTNGWATLSVIDLSDGNKQVDSILFEMKYALKDGSNTAFYQDYALDFEDNTKMDTNGNPSTQWDEVTLYNTNQNLYMRKLRITNALLGNQPWVQSNSRYRCTWPDNTITKINYPLVIVRSASFDTDLTLDLDMNRH